ncbi:hypothetical protein BC943DRAFT_325886 [Umbelopsis sp. AD052]|nr:hypothetical protein BC943DRAFT_325886 [Umbelopsis sp. AD052]
MRATISEDLKSFSGKPFPLIMQNDDNMLSNEEDAVSWIKDYKPAILDCLQQHGAVLLRSMPLDVPEAFSLFARAFNFPKFRYINGAAIRHKHAIEVYTECEIDASLYIFLHHELAQSTEYPRYVLFFCDQPAAAGGETMLLSSIDLYDRIEKEMPEFVRELEAKGVLYTRYMSEYDMNDGNGRGWKNSLWASTKKQAENEMTKLGLTWEWLPNEGLLTKLRAPATRVHPQHGRKVWFNHITNNHQIICRHKRLHPEALHLSNVTFGDGSPFPEEKLHRIIQIQQELCYDVQWRHGDVLLIDNFAVQHGRRPYDGSRRNVFISSWGAEHGSSF